MAHEKELAFIEKLREVCKKHHTMAILSDEAIADFLSTLPEEKEETERRQETPLIFRCGCGIKFVTNIYHSNGYIYIVHSAGITFFKYTNVNAPYTANIGDLVTLLWNWVNMYTAIPPSNNYFPTGW